MSVIFDNDANLPGVFTEVLSDISYGYDTSLFGTTDSIAIIGTAFNGPVATPTPIYSKDYATYIFGKVYDSEKKHESSLISGIFDAWDRGCRTIWAVRVGGKDLYKDFDFRIDNGYRLRLSSRNPSNTGKNCYIYFDNTKGLENISFYKPAERATISEKRQGMVTSDNAVLVAKIGLGAERAVNYDSSIIDMINIFNSHAYNNVLTLSIVDENGADVTSSAEAYNIPLGAMYPGVYFIGRDKNTSDCAQKTTVKFCVPGDGNVLPYTAIANDSSYFKKLIMNTDVSQRLPIYFSKAEDFKAVIKKASITMAEDWDFLSQSNVVDRAWAKNSVDYEETGLTPFELYQHLGDGYAITAHAIRRTKIDSNGNEIELAPIVKETPVDDENRVQPIKDGVYSIIQNQNIKYRALVCAATDQKIPGKLPRVKDFRKVTGIKTAVLPRHTLSGDELKVVEGSEVINIIPKLNETPTETPVKYKFVFREFEEPVEADEEFVNDNIYSDEIFDYATKMDEDDLRVALKNGVKYPAGTLLVTGSSVSDFVLYYVNTEGIPQEVTESYDGHTILVDSDLVSLPTDPDAFNQTLKTYVDSKLPDGDSRAYSLIAINGILYVIKNETAEIIGDYSSLVADDQGETLLNAVVKSVAQPSYGSNGEIIDAQEPMGLVEISSQYFANITIEEMVDHINSHKVLSKFFTAELTKEGTEYKNNFVIASKTDLENNIPTFIGDNESVVNVDRETVWDYSLYIPYRTTDNFARQLAQHCTYTELKTAPAYGVIGCERMVNTSLKEITKKVTYLLNIELTCMPKQITVVT